MRRLLLVAAAMLAPATLLAQASQFGVRSLGLPVLPLSARGQGTGGGFGFFDPETSLNPASIAGVRAGTASFNVRQFWRDTENPYGTSSGNDTQFPLVFIGGPLGPKWNVSVSVAAYTDRTFALASSDTLTIRDQPVAVTDTTASKGGINDIRVGFSYRIGTTLAVGFGVHALTGSNRIEFRRHFSDSSYATVRLQSELSFAGPGLSAGLIAEPVRNLRLAALLRWDGTLRYNKDSTRLGEISMPLTLGAGVQWSAARSLSLAGHVLARNWSVADEDIRNRGGTGARNTIEVAGGTEFATNGRRPSQFPIRLGARYATLPFPLVAGGEGSEVMVSAGTGVRFTGGRGSLDLALERAWRSEGAFKEQSFMLMFGVGIRP
jgi:hypothetical protein